MLDYTQSFQEFSSSLKPLDLALYAGIGLVLWVLFRDRLSPVQQMLGNLVDKSKSIVNPNQIVKPSNKDLFFDLVVSWKRTRDLAELNGCSEAVKVADEMFPHLSPTACSEIKI